MNEPIEVWIDGASRGNPGKAGAGALILDDSGKQIKRISEYLGNNLTNNQAEYNALIEALKYCKGSNFNILKIFSDSELLVKQMKEEYSVNSGNIKPLFEKAKNLEKSFDKVIFEHIERSKNEEADELANKAIDDK